MRPDAACIDSMAADWVVKLDRGLTPDEERQLNQWLGADPRCRGALARAQAIWAYTDRARILKGSNRAPAVRNRLSSPRRWAIAAALIVAVVGGKMWRDFALNHPSTAVGEIRQVALQDGSQVTLDTNSQVDVDYKSRTRLLTLERGVAVFEVSPDSQRPFVVQAGSTRVRAVGTRFLVRRSEKGDEVIVLHGTVDVWRDLQSPEPAVRLTAQHRSVASAASVSSPELMTAPQIEQAVAWEGGVIALSGQTLAEAAAEFNRYNRSRRISVDSALAKETVVGRFRSSDPGAFAHAAAAMLTARVRLEGELIFLEPAKP